MTGSGEGSRIEDVGFSVDRGERDGGVGIRVGRNEGRSEGALFVGLCVVGMCVVGVCVFGGVAVGHPTMKQGNVVAETTEESSSTVIKSHNRRPPLGRRVRGRPGQTAMRGGDCRGCQAMRKWR